MSTESRAPLIVGIVLLLMPLLYVVSYFALATPFFGFAAYRYGGPVSAHVYWPLEQVDRTVRPWARVTPNWFVDPKAIPILHCPSHPPEPIILPEPPLLPDCG